MNLKRSLGTLVKKLPSSQTERRDESEEQLRSLGKEKTFIRGVNEPEERLSGTSIGGPLFSKVERKERTQKRGSDLLIGRGTLSKERMNLKRGLDILVEGLFSLKARERDEPKEELMLLDRERTFIRRVDKPEERLRHLVRKILFFKNKRSG
jgi:hypothetical protein